MKYFIIENNQQQGPYTIYELKDRNLASDTLVWAEGMTEWTPAWQVKELHDFLYGTTPDSATPPPVPEMRNAESGGRKTEGGMSSTSESAIRNPQSAVDQQPIVNPQTAYSNPQSAIRNPHKSHWKTWLTLGILLVLLVAVMGLTCPQRYAHRRAIRTMVENNTRKDITTGNQLLDAALKIMMSASGSDEVLDETLNGMLRYHNYLLFSTTTFNDSSDDIRASIGLFGHVFTQHEDELLEKLGSQSTIQINQSSSLKDDEPQADEPQADDSQSDDQSLTGDKDVDDAIDAVGKVVKNKVKESADSASSEGIGKLIDEVIDLVKGN